MWSPLEFWLGGSLARPWKWKRTYIVWKLEFVEVLSPWLNFNLDFAVERLDGHWAAEHSLWNRDYTVGENILFVSTEVGMWLHVYFYHEVAWGSLRGVVTLLWNPQVHSAVHSLGHVNCLRHVLLRCTLAAASRAWVPDNLALTTAHPAHLLDAERTLLHKLEALTSTSVASGRWRSWSCTRTFARATDVHACERDLLRHTVDGIHEVDFHREDDVVSLCSGPWRASFLWLPTSEEFLKLLEYVLSEALVLSTHASLPEKLFEACSTEWVSLEGPSSSSLGLLVSAHSSLVVDVPFVFVTQGLVCSENKRELTRWSGRTSPSLRGTCSRQDGTSSPSRSRPSLFQFGLRFWRRQELLQEKSTDTGLP